MFKTGDDIRSKAWAPVLDNGRHDRAQLGFILMSTDLASEQDFFDMAPPGVCFYIYRVKTDFYTTFTSPGSKPKTTPPVKRSRGTSNTWPTRPPGCSPT